MTIILADFVTLGADAVVDFDEKYSTHVTLITFFLGFSVCFHSSSPDTPSFPGEKR